MDTTTNTPDPAPSTSTGAGRARPPGLYASGRHPVNIGHLVMGLAFLLIVGIWALVQTDTVTGDDVRWLLPIPWVTAGVAGLAAFALKQRSRAQDGSQDPSYAGYDPAYDRDPNDG